MRLRVAWLRRRWASMVLILVGLLMGVTWALRASQAQSTTIALGTPVTADITDPGGSARFSFTANPGQRLFVMPDSQTNGTRLDWYLEDTYGRRVLANLGTGNLVPMGPAAMMGGTYDLVVEAEDGFTGSVAFTVDSPNDSTTPLALGVEVDTDIGTRGEVDTYTLDLQTATEVYFDLRQSSNAGNLNVVLTDGLGNTHQALTAQVSDLGPFSLPAGEARLEVRSEQGRMATYRFAVVEPTERVDPSVPVDTVATTAVGTAERVEVPIEVPATGEYSLEVLPNTTNAQGLNWALYDPDGDTVVPFTIQLFDGEPMPLRAGTYTLVLRTESGGTGTAEWRLNTVVDTTQAITYNTPVTTSIDVSGQQRDFTFTAAAGDVVAIHVQSSVNAISLDWVLTDGLGRVLPIVSTFAGDVLDLALLGGDYTLTLKGNAGQTGSLTFELVPKVVQTASLAIGDPPVSGAIDSVGKRIEYTFTAAPGQLIDIVPSNTTNSGALNWRLVDASGLDVLPRTTFLSTVVALPLVGGSYTLEVLPENDQLGSFDVQIVDAGLATYSPSGTAYTVGTVVSGNVSPGGGPDPYAFTLTQPTRVFFDLQVGSFFLDWTLTDPVGRQVFSLSALGSSTDFGPVTLQPGTYTLAFLDPSDSGLAYQFEIHEVPEPAPVPLALEAAVSTAISTPGELQRYEFTLATDTWVYLNYVAGNPNVRWWMEDALGMDVFRDSQAFVAQGPHPLVAGTYTVYVRAALGDVPTYEFQLRESTPTVLAGALDQEITGQITAPGDTVTYQFAVTTEIPRAVLDLVQGSSSLYWVLRDPEGREMFAKTQAAVNTLQDFGPFRLRPGTYELEMDGLWNQVVNEWRFVLGASPETAESGVLNQPYDHDFVAARERKTWTIDVPQDARLYFDVQLVGLQGFQVDVHHRPSNWRAYRGGFVNSNTYDGGPWNVPAGTLEVAVQHVGGFPQSFGFEINDVIDEDRGDIPLNWVIDAEPPSIGGSIRWQVSPENPGDPYTFDLMRGEFFGRWSLEDPVGTPVFGPNAAAWYPGSHDRGPFPLAPGLYDLVVSSDRDLLPSTVFRVTAPEDPPITDPGCLACDDLDIVFVFDTSSSMINEAQQMCDLTDDLVDGLRGRGIDVTVAIWGITDTLYIPCATSFVFAELGNQVPGNPPADLATLGASCLAHEDWGLASAVIADRYPWRADAARLVVPMSDEGPYCGSGINDQDQRAVEWAAQIASLKDVVVSPFLTAAEVDETTLAMAALLAQGTGGTWVPATFEPEDLLPAIEGVAGAACDTIGEGTAPIVDMISPPSGSTIPTTQPFVLAGHVRPENTLRPVTGVTIDGLPVEVFDGVGGFFTTVTLDPGLNRLPVTIQQDCGLTEFTIDYIGGDPNLGPIAGFGDVSASIDDAFSVTAFATDDDVLLGRVEAINRGPTLPGPLYFVVGNDLDPTVTPVGATSTLPTGERIYEVLPYKAEFLAGSSTEPLDLAFDNPDRTNVHFTRQWLAPENTAPLFTSTPSTFVAPGATYTYTPTVVDPNGQAVTVSVDMAPTGMALSGGTLSWSPAPNVRGVFDVRLRADDGAGGVGTQRFAVTVDDAGPNRPPLFVTAPVTQIDSGTDYAYDARAVDADNDLVTYALAAAPSGMTITASGDVRWSGPADGTYLVGLQASDGNGGIAAQAYTLTVGPAMGDTASPVITSLPDLLAVADEPYTYAATATDADGDPLTWSLTAAPPGMTVDSGDGVVSFTPTAAEIGPHPVTLVVNDGQGGTAEQTWTLEVLAEAPNARPFFVTTPPARAWGGDPYLYEARAVDPEGEELLFRLVSGPPAMTLESNGDLLWFPPSQDADVDVVVRVQDPQGATAEQSFTIDLDPKRSTPGDEVEAYGPLIVGGPTIDIGTPIDGARLTLPTDIAITSAPGPGGAPIASWFAITWPIGASLDQAETLAEGVGRPPDTVGRFDPTLRQNGLYMVRVEAIDEDGNIGRDTVAVVVDGALKLGAYDIGYLDAEWSSSVFSAELIRTYSTLRKDEVGDFGHGWALSMDNVEVFTNGPLGDTGWTQSGCSAAFVFGSVCTSTSRPHIVGVRWPNGTVDVFDLTPTAGSSFFAPLVPIGFTPRPGTNSTLAPVAGDEGALIIGDSLFGGFGSALYDPQQFWLTDNRGVRYLLDVDDGLVQTVDPNGNTVTYGPDGIVPDRGVGVRFERDGYGRITKMIRPYGEIDYLYDAAGDLVKVTESGRVPTTFTYDDAHRLVSYGDEGAAPLAVVTYDASGRMVRREDNAGVFEETVDLTSFTRTVVGPSPNRTTTTTYNLDGLVERIEVVDGAKTRWTMLGYTDFRLSSITRSSGSTESFVHDRAGRVTRHVDRDGQAHEYDYNALGRVTERRLNGRTVASVVYDDRGNSLQRRGPNGEVYVTTTYNAWGSPVTFRDADGVGGSFQYDASGRVSGFDFGGPAGGGGASAGGGAYGVSNVTVQFQLGPDGEVLGFEKNGQTVPRAELNADTGDLLRYYDENFHVQRWIWADGELKSKVDKLGNTNRFEYGGPDELVAETTRVGQVIQYQYDSETRLFRIDGPDTWIEYTYGDFDEVVRIANPDAVIDIDWDYRGFMTKVTTTPSKGGWGPVEVEYEYFDSGRLRRMRTPYGTVRTDYDLDGFPYRLVDSNAGTWAYTWRDDGPIGSVTAPDGRETTYVYTDALRLESITALAANGATLQSMSFEHDSFGRVTRRIDHEGVHDYTYVPDRIQLESVDHPPGSAIADETYTYDNLGNRTSWGPHKLGDVQHDAGDRLVSDRFFTYQYDAEGRLVRRRNKATNAITTYSWNSFDQLTGVVEPDGTQSTYTYDGLGRRITVKRGSTTRHFVHDGWAEVAVLNGSGALVRWHVLDFWGDALGEWTPTSGTYYLHDQLWTRTGWLDAGGLKWEARDSFGNTAPVPERTQPQSMAWHSQDPTGLIFMTARYMDPAVGRFISEDPQASADLYSYVHNDPVNLFDPYGASAIEAGLLNKNSAERTAPPAGATGLAVRCLLQTSAEGILLTAVTGVVDPLSIAIDWAECTVTGGTPPPPGGLLSRLTCFPGGTPVTTPFGPVPIESLDITDRVVAREGEPGPWQPVLPATKETP